MGALREGDQRGVFPDTPLMCAYDTRALDPAIVAIAGHTHPMLLHVCTDAAAAAVPVPLPSETFVDAARFVARYDTAALHPYRPRRPAAPPTVSGHPHLRLVL